MFEHWDEVELDLRVEATLALDEGRPPAPLLVAFHDDGPLAVVGLRPFDGEGALQALVEVLALLIPLGARRVALGLPGRADGAAADAAPAALAAVGGHPVLVIATAVPGPGATAGLEARILPLAHDGDCWQWRDGDVVDIDAEAWQVTRAVGVLLQEGPEGLSSAAWDRGELRAQLARCLLLGHTVALAPDVADALEPGRAAGTALHPPSPEP